MRAFETIVATDMVPVPPAQPHWEQPDEDRSEWYVVAELPLPDGELDKAYALRYRMYAEAVRRAQQASRETCSVYAVYEVIEGEPELVVLVHNEKLFVESGL